MVGLKIGYFGEKGAYSNIAAERLAEGEYVPYKFIRSIFDGINKGEIDLGVVPIENSIEGAVSETYDNLYRDNLFIVKEYYLRISHCLIGFPDSEIDDIRYVHSHPQALAQCSDFIFSHNFIPVSEYDTAGSVEIVKGLRDKARAAIASELAASIYGMHIIQREIENNKNNYTRFFLLSKSPEKPDGKTKTSMVFSTSNTPGALYRVLSIFDKYSINMSKIESRPVKFNPFNYIFFVDIENNKNTENAINEIKNIAGTLKILGTYKDASFNFNS